MASSSPSKIMHSYDYMFAHVHELAHICRDSTLTTRRGCPCECGVCCPMDYPELLDAVNAEEGIHTKDGIELGGGH